MLRFIDGFDHYTDTELGLKWTNVNDQHLQTYAARTGSKGIYINNGSGRYIEKVLDAQATWIIGFAAQFVALDTGNPILSIKDGASTTHLDLWLNGSGHLYVARGATTLGTGTVTFTTGVWYFIELKVTISDTVGVVLLKVNGTTDINLTSQDTRNAGNATADRFRFHHSGSGMYLDDVYACDGTGSTNNDILGDCKVETLFPSGNGNSSQLLGSDSNSTDNYLLVDETAPNSDTDYVGSATVSEKDTYAFGNMSTVNGTVFGVQLVPWAKKSDAGGRDFKTIARLSSTEVDGTDTALSTSYTYYPEVRETKPGGGAWTITDVNAAEFGIKVYS